MATSKKCIARLAISGLGALLIGVPVVTAHAAEPATPAMAEALAQHNHVRAEQARARGGVGYKTGEVQRAEDAEARYTTRAEQLSAPALPFATAPTPVADHYAALAQHYRTMGGGAVYKWGRLDWAEAQQQRAERIEMQYQPAAYFAEPATSEEPAPSLHPACETVSKPVVRTLACAQ
jgi:hypothetical protein